MRKRSPAAAVAVCMIASALAILDLLKVQVSVPTIQSTFAADATDIQLIVGGYAVAFAIALVPGGRWGDSWSRGRVIVIGLTGFTLGSIAAAMAPDVTSIVIARIVQGASAGLIVPQTMGSIQALYPPDKRGPVFGAFGAVSAIAPALGPVLGGALVDWGGVENGWRWNFWLNVPIAAALVVLALIFVPQTNPHKNKARPYMDPLGFALVAAAVMATLAPFVLTNGDGDSPLRWLSLAAAAAFVAALIAWERRVIRKDKVGALDLRLFSIRSYRVGTVIMVVAGSIGPAMFIVVAYFLQVGEDVPATLAGTVMIAFALAASLGATVAGRLKKEHRRLGVTVGASIQLAGYFAYLAVNTSLPSYVSIVVALTIAGFGGGILNSSNMSVALADVPPTAGGSASAVQQMLARIALSISMAAALALYLTFAEIGPRIGLTATAIMAICLSCCVVTLAVAEAAGAHRNAKLGRI